MSQEEYYRISSEQRKYSLLLQLSTALSLAFLVALVSSQNDMLAIEDGEDDDQ